MNKTPPTQGVLRRTLSGFKGLVRFGNGPSPAANGVDGNQQTPVGSARLRLSADMACHHGDQYKIDWVEVTDEAQILFALEFCREKQGIVRLEHVADDSAGKPSLQLQAEQGRYMLFYWDSNHSTRCFVKLNPTYNPAAPRGKDYFRGKLMPVRTIITDFDLITRAFQEFARTGELSEAYDFYSFIDEFLAKYNEGTCACRSFCPAANYRRG